MKINLKHIGANLFTHIIFAVHSFFNAMANNLIYDSGFQVLEHYRSSGGFSMEEAIRHFAAGTYDLSKLNGRLNKSRKHKMPMHFSFKIIAHAATPHLATFMEKNINPKQIGTAMSDKEGRGWTQVLRHKDKGSSLNLCFFKQERPAVHQIVNLNDGRISDDREWHRDQLQKYYGTAYRLVNYTIITKEVE